MRKLILTSVVSVVIVVSVVSVVGMAWGQPSPGTPVLFGVPPSGVGAACAAPQLAYLDTSTGCLASCQSSVWTCQGGSGGLNLWTDDGTTLSPTNSGRSVTIGTTVTINQTALATPSAPSISNQGTPGVTTYGYKIVALTAVGTTAPSSEATTTTGNATLDGSNFNRITPPSCASTQVSWMVFRTTHSPTGFVGSANCGGTVDDTGVVYTNISASLFTNQTVGTGTTYAHLGVAESSLNPYALGLSLRAKNLVTGTGSSGYTLAIESSTPWGVLVYTAPTTTSQILFGVESDMNLGLATSQAVSFEALATVYAAVDVIKLIEAEGINVQSGGSVTDAYGLYVARMGDANISNVYGIFIGKQTPSATASYGLYVEDFSNGGTAIRTGPGLVYHGDTVTVDLQYWDFATHQALKIITPNDQSANLVEILAADGTTVLTAIGPAGITKASSGTRFVCIDTNGLLASSSSACSGT